MTFPLEGEGCIEVYAVGFEKRNANNMMISAVVKRVPESGDFNFLMSLRPVRHI